MTTNQLATAAPSRTGTLVCLALVLCGLLTACEPDTAAVPHEGRLRLADLRALTVGQIEAIDPASQVPRNILLFAFDGDWDLAKRVLILDEWPAHARRTALADKKAPRALMQQLIAFRQVDHERHLLAVREDMQLSEQELWWHASGSTSLTSDIDVNLEGSGTEDFVEFFNRRFTVQAGYGLESGLVYDVNVYAEDFLFGAETVTLPNGETVRVARDEYPITDPTVRSGDADAQEQWALVHLRRFMTADEWTAFKAVLPASPTIDGAELRYARFRDDMVREILGDDAATLDPTRSPMSAFRDLALARAANDVWADNLLLAASNRLYERKLDVVAALRAELDAAPVPPGDERSGKVATLRDALSEATLFSNEAYTTDGAVNHAVLGLQMREPIRQTRAASMHAFIENVGDALKALERHGDNFGEALLESSKYLWRAGDAVHNARWDALDMPDAETWRIVGHDIAQRIRKDGTLTRAEQRRQAVAAFSAAYPGIRSVAELRSLVLRVAPETARQWALVDDDARLQLGSAVESAPGR